MMRERSRKCLVPCKQGFRTKKIQAPYSCLALFSRKSGRLRHTMGFQACLSAPHSGSGFGREKSSMQAGYVFKPACLYRAVTEALREVRQALAIFCHFLWEKVNIDSIHLSIPNQLNQRAIDWHIPYSTQGLAVCWRRQARVLKACLTPAQAMLNMSSTLLPRAPESSAPLLFKPQSPCLANRSSQIVRLSLLNQFKAKGTSR